MTPAPAMPWTLYTLLAAAGLPAPGSDPDGTETADPVITDLQFDSRRVGSGSLYLAMPGQSTHGARFSAAAVEEGAVAVLTDAAGRELAAGVGVPVVVAEDPRGAMAALSVALNGDPSARVPMFAVTGTNGKTTTVFLLEAALTALGRTVGTLGTIGFRLAGEMLERRTSTVTTPEAPDLQALFAAMADRGADAIAMEVSSHALALKRAAGTTFEVAGFTMLGRDHLDFHPDMEDYFAAKARLFTTGMCRHAVINTDGEWGARLAGMVTDVPVTTVGRREGADVRVLADDPTEDGLGRRVELDLAGQQVSFMLPMPGAHNVDNAALALAMVRAAGWDAAAAGVGLERASVPGRMQRVTLAPRADQDAAPVVIVDFAHTPQAVHEALQAVSVPGRVITVVGAGGDRDRAKRPLMGEAAGNASQVVVVTDDNPRTEDPALIREAVAEGVRDTAAELHVVDGRRAAIATALRMAGPGDAVMVLGKGHERGQQVGDRVLDFDDVQVATEEWENAR